MLTQREIEEYQRLNASDRFAFNRWLGVQVIVGSTFVALMALTVVFSGGQSNLTIVPKNPPILNAQAR